MKRFHLTTWLWGGMTGFALLLIIQLPHYWLLIAILTSLAFALGWYAGRKPILDWQGLCSFLLCFAIGGWILLAMRETSTYGYSSIGTKAGLGIFWEQLVFAHAHSFAIALAGSVIACFAGLMIGAALGMSTGWLRRFLDPLIQTLMAIPILLYFLVGLVVFPPGPATLILVFAITLWLEPARMIQVRLQALREAPFVHVARTMGVGEWRILWRECLPNILPVVWVSFLIVFLNAILLESILGFLGLGLSPGTPSLGRFIEEGGKAWPQYPQYLLGPMFLEVAWMLGLRGLMRHADQRGRPLRVA